MTRTTFDAIVIGGGHNGLVTAAYLARAGQSVLVLEQRATIGGGAATEETFPGCRVDTGASGLGGVCPDVIRDLKLADFGLDIVEPEITVFAPQPDGTHLLLSRDSNATRRSIAMLSERDAGRWDAFRDLIGNATGLLESIYRTTPPNFITAGPRELWPMLQIGSRLRRLGKRTMTEVMRLLPMSLEELLDEWFEHDAVRGVLAGPGVIGVFQGPMSAGTTFTFLNQHVGSNGVIRPLRCVRGGVGKFADALAAAAVRSGAEVRTQRTVDHIIVENGRAVGVMLNSGESFRASRVISSAAPRPTFTELLHPSELDPAVFRRINNIRYRGASARIHLLLNALPEFSALPGPGPHHGAVISISPSIEYLERAYDDAKHGTMSAHPHIEATIPSYREPDRAPDDMHVMSLLVQYAPHRLTGGWTDAARDRLAANAIDTLTAYAPNLRDAIVDRRVVTPVDLETELTLPEGNMYHGELAMDQMFFMRPIPDCARYRTPIEGLYLCGAGTHPGGGVNGYSGFNAAREILKDS